MCGPTWPQPWGSIGGLDGGPSPIQTFGVAPRNSITAWPPVSGPIPARHRKRHHVRKSENLAGGAGIRRAVPGAIRHPAGERSRPAARGGRTPRHRPGHGVALGQSRPVAGAHQAGAEHHRMASRRASSRNGPGGGVIRWTATNTTPTGRAWSHLPCHLPLLLAWHRWAPLLLRLLA